MEIKKTGSFEMREVKEKKYFQILNLPYQLLNVSIINFRKIMDWCGVFNFVKICHISN